MRILHLYSGNLYGGIETYLATLARCRQLAPDFNQQFGICFRGRLWTELVATGVAVHDLGPVRISRPWTVLRARHRLTRLLRQTQFDTVVTHACWPHAVFAPVVVRRGVRLFHRVHDQLTGSNWLEKLAGRTRPELVLANSQFSARSVATVFPDSKVEVLYPAAGPALNGSRLALRRSIRAELGTPENAVVLLQASRLAKWKGHSVLLEALIRATDLPRWEVWITGDPQQPGESQYLAALKEIAKRGKIECRTRFLGRWPDLRALLAAADVLCQPNTEPEPFGLVFVEALYAELPIVASAAGGPLEILDETCGILTPPGNEVAVANALEMLIRDPLLRQQLGAGGPSRAAELCDPVRHLSRFRGFVSQAHSVISRQ